MKLTLLLSLALAGLSSAATIAASFSNSTVANDGTIDISGTDYLQTITDSNEDIDGDGINDSITYTYTMSSQSGADLNNSGVYYGFSYAAAGAVDIAVSIDSIVSSAGYTLASFDGATLISYYQAGASTNLAEQTVTDGSETWLGSTVGFGSVTPDVELNFDDTNALTWTQTDNAGQGRGIHSFNVTFDLTLEEPVAVPEPSSVALLGLGSLALISRRKR